MRVLTISELMRLSRIELTGLFAEITKALPGLPEGSADRQSALLNLYNIRAVLTRRDLAP